MIQTILFAAIAVGCPNFNIVIPKETYALKMKDVKQLEISQKNCKKRFKKNPCIEIFHIVREDGYAIKCGKELDEKKRKK